LNISSSSEKVLSHINKVSPLTSRKLARLIAEYASDKKAIDIAILDMRKVVSFCDYFVLCSGNTDRQVAAIATGIIDGLEEIGLDVPKRQGGQGSLWTLLDLSDVGETLLIWDNTFSLLEEIFKL